MQTAAAIDRFLASPRLAESTRRSYSFDLRDFGASGRRRGSRGENGESGTRAAPSVKRRNERTVESLRAIVAGASPRLPRPSSPT